MKISLAYELYVFFAMIIVGMLEGAVFDFFKAFRKRASSFSVVGILDILYWIFASFIFLIFLVYSSDGELRGYIFIALVLGLVFYFLLFSRWINCLMDVIIRFFLKFFKFFFKILLTPLTFLYKILVGVFRRLKSILFCKSEKKNDKET